LWVEAEAVDPGGDFCIPGARRAGEGAPAALAAILDERGLIELCMLVGHYEMVAMRLNALCVQPDVLPDRPPLSARAIQSLVSRRGASP
jgi:hypothetical protein